MDRTINFGDDEADARYRIQDTSSTGGDLVLAEDLDGGTVLLEYDYSASEWVSRGAVNLSGNDITNAGSVSADTLEADSVVIGGTLYEEDDNSPIDEDNVTSTTFTMANSAPEVIIIPDTSANTVGWNQIRVNGDTTSNYEFVDNSDTRTTGAAQYDVPRAYRSSWYVLGGRGSTLTSLSVGLASAQTGETVAGENLNQSLPITQFTLIAGNSLLRDMKARVYRRVMSV